MFHLIFFSNLLYSQELNPQNSKIENNSNFLVKLDANIEKNHYWHTISYRIQFRNWGATTIENIVLEFNAPHSAGEEYMTYLENYSSPYQEGDIYLRSDESLRKISWQIDELKAEMKDWRIYEVHVRAYPSTNQDVELTASATAGSKINDNLGFVKVVVNLPKSKKPFLKSSIIDSLNVNITSVSLTDTVRNVIAGFPDKIFSYISVTDPYGQSIPDLADTSRWIVEDEITNSGIPVKNIWQPILEYHQEDHSIPQEPDVSNFQITEIRESVKSVSIALVMDYSGSMDSDRDAAEAAALHMIDLMSDNDQAAVIKFTENIFLIQEFTNDKSSLKSAILDRSQITGRSTAFYDAVNEALKLVNTESNRRAIIAYTDGVDNRSLIQVDTLIVKAQRLGVQIFVIGLGDNVDTTVLENIANQTSGHYMYSPSTSEMAVIYSKIFKIIRNYYVLAHISPDPRPDGTWRIIDVMVNSGNFSGRGTGFYKVPYDPAPEIRVKPALIKPNEPVNVEVMTYDPLKYWDLVVKFVDGSKNDTYADDFIAATNLIPNSWTLVEPVFNDTKMRGNEDEETVLFEFHSRDMYDNIDTAFAYLTIKKYDPPDPEIRINPALIKPNEPVSVEVLTHAPLNDWDLRVKFVDGSENNTYADNFIATTSLLTDTWTLVEPVFNDTKMRGKEDEETAIFEFHSKDIYDNVDTTTAILTIKSFDHFKFTENVFKPNLHESFEIKFELSTSRNAMLKVYDISGRVVRNLTSKYYDAGWNSEFWDGKDDRGNFVGGGIYIVTIYSEPLKEWKKFILIR